MQTIDQQADVQPTGTTTVGKYSVTSTLPKGWGKTRPDRSDFYRTPLIVAASVILAILIVTGLIMYVSHHRIETDLKLCSPAPSSQPPKATTRSSNEEEGTGCGWANGRRPSW